MPLAEKQRQLIDRYTLIEDRHERLAAIVTRGQRWPDIPAVERTEARLVRGCASSVWLAGSVESGRCYFRLAAGSSVVKGLAALLTELYDGATPAEIVAWEPEMLEALGLDRQLSPTRLHGLAHIRRAIRDFAATAP